MNFFTEQIFPKKERDKGNLVYKLGSLCCTCTLNEHTSSTIVTVIQADGIVVGLRCPKCERVWDLK